MKSVFNMENDPCAEPANLVQENSHEILKLKQAATLLFNEQNFPKALEKFQAISAREAIDEYALLGVGACQFELNENESAKISFLKVLKINENNIDALGNIAKIHFKNGEYTDSIYYHSRSLKLQPGNQETNLNLALAYQELGNLELALLHFENAKNELNKFEIGLQKGDLLAKFNQFSSALAEFEIALALNRDSTIPLVKIGNLYFNNENYILAFEKFRRAQQISPTDPVGYFNLGACSYKCQSYLMAIHFYSEAIYLNSDFSEAIFHLGICYDAIKQKRLAFECYKAAHQKDPLSLNILFELASKYKIFNLLNESLICYKKILQIDRNNIKASKEISMLNSQIYALNSISSFDLVSERL